MFGTPTNFFNVTPSRVDEPLSCMSTRVTSLPTARNGKLIGRKNRTLMIGMTPLLTGPHCTLIATFLFLVSVYRVCV